MMREAAKIGETQLRYVLITPARNEEKLIAGTLESVTKQTLPPLRWVIVDDGSRDGTAAVIGKYLQKYPWIHLVRLPAHRDRSFAAKVGAFNAGYQHVESLQFELVGNLGELR